MFERIKLRIIRGRQLQAFEVAKVLQDHEDRLKALEAESSSDDGEKITYSFTSYGDKDGTVEWGEGTAETTGVTKGSYTQIEVKTNSPREEFVGQKFFIISSAKANGTNIYKLYTDAGSTGAGIWVSIEEI